MSNPQFPSPEVRKPDSKSRRNRSPADKGYDKKLDGPNRPST
ncbi:MULTISPECIES: spore protein [Cohnella]|nr:MULTISPECIES: spore protein [Cohnella]MBN2982045.1 spore protein [Cohnella algarum]